MRLAGQLIQYGISFFSLRSYGNTKKRTPEMGDEKISNDDSCLCAKYDELWNAVPVSSLQQLISEYEQKHPRKLLQKIEILRFRYHSSQFNSVVDEIIQAKLARDKVREKVTMKLRNVLRQLCHHVSHANVNQQISSTIPTMNT